MTYSSRRACVVRSRISTPSPAIRLMASMTASSCLATCFAACTSSVLASPSSITPSRCFFPDVHASVSSSIHFVLRTSLPHVVETVVRWRYTVPAVIALFVLAFTNLSANVSAWGQMALECSARMYWTACVSLPLPFSACVVYGVVFARMSSDDAALHRTGHLDEDFYPHQPPALPRRHVWSSSPCLVLVAMPGSRRHAWFSLSCRYRSSCARFTAHPHRSASAASHEYSSIP